MSPKWMLGAALTTLVAAAPAVAQMDASSQFGACAIEEMDNETFLGLDINDDSGLTLEEYRDCLEEADLALDESEMAAYESAYADADTNGDAVLVFAEVEAYAAGATDAPQGTVAVTQPAAEVTVRQPAPEVTVTQAEPTVAVEPSEPEVSVKVPRPKVAVDQAEPTVAVQQGEPEVSVTQPEPEVNVSQAQPEVDVTAGRPAVDVDTAEPRVDVAQADPDVSVTQPELDVDVDQQDPDVAVRQATPDVSVEQEGAAGRTTGATDTDTETDPAMASGTAAADDEAPAGNAVAYAIRVDDLEGEGVINTTGEEVGEIEAILLDPVENAPVVIISVGGVFGIGDRELAFPYDDLTIAGDEIILNTTMSEDELKEMPEFDEDAYEALPESMVVR